MYELILLDAVGAVVFLLAWDSGHSISYHLIYDAWFEFLLSAIVLVHMVHIAGWCGGDYVYEGGAIVGAVGWLVLVTFNDQSYVSAHYLGVAVFGLGVMILCGRVLASPADTWSCHGACAFALLALVTFLASAAFGVLLWMDQRGPAAWTIERVAFLGVVLLLAVVSVVATGGRGWEDDEKGSCVGHVGISVAR